MRKTAGGTYVWSLDVQKIVLKPPLVSIKGGGTYLAEYSLTLGGGSGAQWLIGIPQGLGSLLAHKHKTTPNPYPYTRR